MTEFIILCVMILTVCLKFMHGAHVLNEENEE